MGVSTPPPREPWDPLTQFIYSLLATRTKTDLTYAVIRNLRQRVGSCGQNWRRPSRLP